MDYKKIYRFKLYLNQHGMKSVPYWISNAGNLIQEDELSDKTLFWGTSERARVEQSKRIDAHGGFSEATSYELFLETVDQRNVPEKILKKLKGEAWRSKTIK